MSKAHTAVVSGWVGHCSTLRTKEWMSPPTQFIPVGTLVNYLCQTFNCFGNRTLFLQPMALILLKEAREPWQGRHMRTTMVALPLPTWCRHLGTHCAHIHMEAHSRKTHAATMNIGSSDRNKLRLTRKEVGYRAGLPSVSVPPSFLSPEG